MSEKDQILCGSLAAMENAKAMAQEILVISLMNQANALGLACPYEVTVKEAARIYNGVGASWMKERWRNALDWISKTLLPAVFLHDIDFAKGDGTRGAFSEANERLEKNGRICADATYGWYNPLRYLVRRQAKSYRRLCDAFGWPAFVAAVEENKQHNANLKEAT